ncbi:MAG: NADH-quinone oxidoreductase subunit NuoH [Ignavibacteria bacterium]|nr:NADH-quinone oxidoreductase subunit NuoH [Ignavibacteria bacterium]
MENIFTQWFGDNLLTYILIPVPIIAYVSVFALYAVLAERKISAWMQNRIGPNRTDKFGLLQTILDAVKLMQKELILPSRRDNLYFRMAPYIVFTAAFMGYAVLPFSSVFIGVDLNLGLFYFFAITSIGVVGVLMAGWASNNKYSLFGGMRTVAQIVSYEIPTALSAIVVVMLAGTLSMQKFALIQSGGIFNWYIFGGPGSPIKIIIIPIMVVSAVLLFLSTLAETNRTPFDLTEADSELVAGVHIEYSGMMFAMFFFAEYAQMFAVSGIVTTLFLGGWQSPFGELIPFLNTPVFQVFWFLAKGLSLVFVQIWLRWTLPRVRIDQLMTMCWKFFIPIALVNLFLIGLYIIFA